MLSGSASLPPLSLHNSDDTDTRSPYQQAELRAADWMRTIRECVTQVDKLDPRSSPAERLGLNNRIRQCDVELRATLQEARRLAVMERRVESFGKLQAQGTATQQLISAHYSTLVGFDGGDSGATAFALMADTVGTEPTHGNAHTSDEPNRMHYDIAQDAEFLNFFHDTRQGDARIDVALDRIEHGVHGIRDNAHGIQYELQAQESVLQRTEKKTDQGTTHMSGMNRKLQRSIQKLEKSRLITYVVLGVTLLILIAVIIFLGKTL